MPGFNRKGPDGQGSQTGRKLGKCNPNSQQTDEKDENKKSRGGGRRRNDQCQNEGTGAGKGQGRGLGRRFGGGNS